MCAIRNALLVLLMGLSLTAAASPCEQWFFQLQQAFDRAGIEDAQARTLPGFPHLGINRWLAFLQQQATTDAQQQQWLRLATAKAWRDQTVMLKRLPQAQRPPADRPAEQLLSHCLPVLAATTAFDPLPRARVPDSYATWLRVVGLYPLTAWLAGGSLEHYHQEMTARFTAPAPEPVKHYLPATSRRQAPTPAVLADNPLRVPLPDRDQLQALLARYAPALAVADTRPWNRPGSLALSEAGPAVNPENPVSYYWPSWTHFRGQHLLQLNYQFWFSKRPRQQRPDWYAGKLDGLIWRVTLKPDGGVLFYDSIHPCGCYHKVYPVDPALEEAPIKGDKPVFYPHPVADANRHRLTVLLEPDTHYVVRVATTIKKGETQTYPMQPATTLRALPRPDGGVGSLFNARGRVPASRRGERFFLWPMGIPSAGAMRQPGQHAIAFKGRRHFDEPRIADVLFSIKK